VGFKHTYVRNTILVYTGRPPLANSIVLNGKGRGNGLIFFINCSLVLQTIMIYCRWVKSEAVDQDSKKPKYDGRFFFHYY